MSLLSFVYDLQYEDIPLATRNKIQYSLIDIVGILAAAKQTHTNHCVTEFAKCSYPPSGDKDARLFFDGSKVSQLGAAWVGGFNADSLDSHEGHFLSKGHAGATVLPGLIALIDAQKSNGKEVSGKEFITLLAIAYEVSLRAGVALMQTASDYHASGAFSGIGLVAAGARLLNLPQEQFYHALGIAEYFGPRCPMMRVVDHPTMLRDAHGGGAFNGLNALSMAQAGITGAPAATVEFPEVANCWESLQQGWEIDNQYFKPWPVCRWAQPALTAITQRLKEYSFKSEQIRAVTIETFHESTRLQGYTPKNADEAQYALAFPVAALLYHGQLGPRQVTGEAIFDQQVLALAQKIRIIESDELSKRFPAEILSRVIIELDDGETLASPITEAKGDPDTPMSKQDILEKFYLATAEVLTKERQEQILDLIESLDDVGDIADFINEITATL